MALLHPNDQEYKIWLAEVKAKIAHGQVKVAVAVNSALIQFYWELGQIIVSKQTESNWGSKLIEQLALDLKKDLPGVAGFSRTNLYYIKQFYEYFNAPAFSHVFVPRLEGQTGNAIVPQAEGQNSSSSIPPLISQLPWGHIKILIAKIKEPEECLFYIRQTIQNNWSRDVLALQIKSNLYARQGNAVTNFKATLPNPQSDLAEQTIKDPYVFDFLTLAEPYKEKDIEDQLVSQVSKFLLELGKGFAFLGRQYHIQVAEQDYYIDLLFYHVTLKCYVVIELKNTKFIPEYAGKMNFYLSAVDSLLRTDSDQPTIGIMLCRDKNNIEAEFALRDLNKPMGVSEFQFTEILPNELRSSLPTIEEIESGLESSVNKKKK